MDVDRTGVVRGAGFPRGGLRVRAPTLVSKSHRSALPPRNPTQLYNSATPGDNGRTAHSALQPFRGRGPDPGRFGPPSGGQKQPVLLRLALFPIDFLFLGGARDYGRSVLTTAGRLGKHVGAAR